ncbi:hypothetical protein [Nocardia rhizosphaerae]|uniref:tRNA nuclease CdiA C-terminal domain-containing protein n=1 Tax=Nocardia rhizosphaerae TaxID=1691571 RepID=A0ABV8L0T6_9NOCA
MTPASSARTIERLHASRSMLDTVSQSVELPSSHRVGQSIEAALQDALDAWLGNAAIEPIDDRRNPGPSTATPPIPGVTPPPPTTAGPPNIAPTPPKEAATGDISDTGENVAEFWEGDDEHIPRVTIDAPFADVMGTGYRIYADPDGKVNLVQVRDGERIIADIEMMSDGSYRFHLMDEENLAGVYDVSPDGETVTVRQSLPALWDRWGDLITGPDDLPANGPGVVLEFLWEIGSAAASDYPDPPDLPFPSSIEGPANPSNTPGTPEYEKRQQELAMDPAKGGRVSGASMREAAVGLEAERTGSVPGPISRAQLGPDGGDMGEFVDAEGTRWDVKSSPDITPFYTKAPGKPIPHPQSDEKFIDMINEDIASGEKILLDPVGMSDARKTHIKDLILAHPEWYDHVVWVEMDAER